MKEELIHLTPMLRRFAYSLTRSAPHADHLLQNTLERLLSPDIPPHLELAK
ncbi:MAG: RNA polymerase sigma factor, partial [Cellvibrio sp.]